MKLFILNALCFLLAWLPIPLGSYRPWAFFIFSFCIFLLFLTHLFLVFKHKKKLLPPRYSAWLLAPLLAVISVLIIQIIPGIVQPQQTIHTINHLTTLSIDTMQTKITLLKTVTLFVFSWLLFSYCKQHQQLKKVSYAIIAGGLLQALYAIYLNLNPDFYSVIFNYSYEKNATGSFTYKNFLANYLAMCLALGIGVLISQLSLTRSGKSYREKARGLLMVILSTKILLRSALILMIIALILTRSRMGNSAFFISLALVSIFSFFYYNKKPINLRALIISFFILDLLIVGAMFGVEKVKERLLETSLSSETRDEVVRDSLPIIKDHLLLGTGGGTFYTAFPKYQPEPYSGYYDNAHNDYIQFTVEFGLPVTLILGLMIISAFIMACKVMIKRKTPLYQGVAFGGAVAIIHMVLHSTVDYSLQAGANSVTFITILALVIMSANLARMKTDYS
ncbi:MAG: O-antigen ligase family protein [Alteromonadaceae bacterium]|nr:O-antigen ligase family protein [Alteromonadaceae bacterium]